jgi:hypothetical protein
VVQCPRGILVLALRLEWWGTLSELFLSVNDVPHQRGKIEVHDGEVEGWQWLWTVAVRRFARPIDLSGDGAEGCTLEEKDQPEGTSCELHEWDLTRERRR